MTKQLIIGCIAVLSLISCKMESKKIETETDKPKAEITIEKSSITSQDYGIGSPVPNDLVCMVNDAYMGKPQIPVPVNGKTYYGCCQMCVERLNNERTARVGTDPFSGKSVDKTEAYIVLMNKEGRVSYFESKQNFLNYKKGI